MDQSWQMSHTFVLAVITVAVLASSVLRVLTKLERAPVRIRRK